MHRFPTFWGPLAAKSDFAPSTGERDLSSHHASAASVSHQPEISCILNAVERKESVTDRIRQGTTKIDKKRASSLLYPIAAFLHAGGITDKAALDSFAAALKKVSKAAGARKMEHIGYPTQYADIVAMWVRNKRFLDRSGWPRRLLFNGRSGFSALVRSVSQQTDPDTALTVLMRYGNVKRTRRGEYQLVRPFFYTSGPKSMAYEPVAYFLSDASETLSKILKRSRKWRGPDLFWQKTENDRISEATAKKFTAFAKERSLVFLDELDDWLEAHRNTTANKRGPRRRIGLGIFSIYSDREPLSKTT
jgi:hypothetical protein